MTRKTLPIPVVTHNIASEAPVGAKNAKLDEMFSNAVLKSLGGIKGICVEVVGKV